MVGKNNFQYYFIENIKNLIHAANKKKKNYYETNNVMVNYFNTINICKHGTIITEYYLEFLFINMRNT